MKKRFFCALLALLLILSLLPQQAVHADAAVDPDQPMFEGIIDAAYHIIITNEVGSEEKFASVVADDCGAISVGLLGWHAESARSLLMQAMTENDPYASEILSEESINYIVNPEIPVKTTNADGTVTITIENDWSNYIPAIDQVNEFSALLSTESSRLLQVEKVREDITKYVKHGIALGINSPAALIFFADFENQYGGGSDNTTGGGSSGMTLRCEAEVLKKDTVDTLDEYYPACLKVTSTWKAQYNSRREKTYNSIKSTFVCSAVDGGESVHVYDEGTITKEPTETEWGERTRHCKLCGAAITELVGKIAGADTIGIIVGDCNLDGEVNSLDITVLALAQAANAAYPDSEFGGFSSEEARENGDVNSNGRADVGDLTAICRYVSGIAATVTTAVG